MTITAIILDANNSYLEDVIYTSKRVTPRTLLKALRSVEKERTRFNPVIEINGKRFTKFEINFECHGCNDIRDAEWFLNKKVAL